MTLRSWPLPFVAAFVTLMSLLLVQFLIMHLKDIVGKGLPPIVVVELVAYSLAYMVTLAGPMSVLIATLASYGTLAESRAYAVIKSSGISLWQLMWPVLLVGVLVTAGQIHFNNVILPEANHRMRGLWLDIQRSRPGFAIEPGVFYTGLDGYAMLVDSVPPGGRELHGITVFDYGRQGQATLSAQRATLSTSPDGNALLLTLHDGEVHRRSDTRDRERLAERYERLAFKQHRLRLDVSGLTFERGELAAGVRSDRTTPTRAMIITLDSLETSRAQRRDTLLARLYLRDLDLEALRGFDGTRTRILSDTVVAGHIPLETDVMPPPSSAPEISLETLSLGKGADSLRAIPDRLATREATPEERADLYDAAIDRARIIRNYADTARFDIHWIGQRANRNRIEIYKKYSMAISCIVFVLVGVPLGLAIPRMGLPRIGIFATVIFLFYWITLVQGEKLSDRGLLPVWLGMWGANMIVGVLASYLCIREARDPAWRLRLFKRSLRT